MDIRLELGEVWEFKERYQDFTTLLGIVYAFEEEEGIVYLIAKTEVREQYKYYQSDYGLLIRKVQTLSFEEMLTHPMRSVRSAGVVLLVECQKKPDKLVCSEG